VPPGVIPFDKAVIIFYKNKNKEKLTLNIGEMNYLRNKFSVYKY